MKIKAFIPNFVTLLNLFCGSIAIILVVNNQFVLAGVFVFLGIFFDFFDGLLARKLNVQSELGIQLDSLADMVTSGLVPGLIMYKLLELATNSQGINLNASWLDCTVTGMGRGSGNAQTSTAESFKNLAQTTGF